MVTLHRAMLKVSLLSTGSSSCHPNLNVALIIELAVPTTVKGQENLIRLLVMPGF